MNPVIEIEKMGQRAVGIGRHGGKVMLVPLTAPGDRVEVQIIGSHRNYDEAELVHLQKSSPLRRKPPCPYFGRCGGCQLQHLEPSYQRTLKGDLFREMIIHNGGVTEECIGEMLAASRELGYRSRLEMHVLWSTEPLLGFMARGSRRVVPVERCLLAMPHILTFLAEVKGLLMEAKATDVRRIEISCDSHGDGISIVFWASRRLSRRTRNALSKLSQDISKLRGLYLAHQRGGKLLPLWEQENGSAGVFYQIPSPNRSGQLILEAWPGVFRQVNPFANCLLIATAMSWIEEVLPERILEIYSGMGNLTLPMSHLAKEVVAVEVNPVAVENAQANTHRNDIRNIRWIKGSVKRVMQRFLKEVKSFDLVIMDPPRSGAWEALKEITALAPDRIIYISCDPATLSRDIRFLKQKGSYCVERTHPLDMFPQSFHLESITLLKRANPSK